MLNGLHDVLPLSWVFGGGIAKVGAKFRSPFCRIVRRVKTVNCLESSSSHSTAGFFNKDGVSWGNAIFSDGIV